MEKPRKGPPHLTKPIDESFKKKNKKKKEKEEEKEKKEKEKKKKEGRKKGRRKKENLLRNASNIFQFYQPSIIFYLPPNGFFKT